MGNRGVHPGRLEANPGAAWAGASRCVPHSGCRGLGVRGLKAARGSAGRPGGPWVGRCRARAPPAGSRPAEGVEPASRELVGSRHEPGLQGLGGDSFPGRVRGQSRPSCCCRGCPERPEDGEQCGRERRRPVLPERSVRGCPGPACSPGHPWAHRRPQRPFPGTRQSWVPAALPWGACCWAKWP